MYPDILAAEAFAYLLVFTRIGMIMIVVPALGEQAIPARVRLTFALILSYLIYTLVAPDLPAMPANTLALAGLLIGEIVIGAMIGLVARMTLAALHVAGSAMAIQTGLAAAQQFDPAQRSQGALVAGFLSLMGLTLLFVTDLHHVIIAAMQNSYNLFPVAMPLPFDDFAVIATGMLTSAFRVGLQLAAPFLVYGLVFYFGLGILARLAPAIPIFFVAMPLNIIAGFVIMLFVISAMLSRFADYFSEQMAPLVQ